MKMKGLYVIGLLMILLLFGAGYSSHMLSSETRVNISGVFGDATEGRNWTAPGANEIFNFTVVNDGSSNDPVVSINISMQNGFTLINTTIGKSLANWDCRNSSLTRVDCSNASGPGLGNGSRMHIWFNATASSSVTTEESKSWTINTRDGAGQTNGTTLYSTIDGKVTGGASLDSLDAYMNLLPVLNWTNNCGHDTVSGLANDTRYTIYHSSDSATANFTANGTTGNTYYPTAGLEANHRHYFKVETRDNAGNAVNSSVVNTVIDMIAPVIGLNTTDNANFSNTYYPRLYFNATDNFDTNMSCVLFVDGYPNGSAYIQNNTRGLSILANTSLLGTHYWHVNCSDDAGNTGMSTPARTLNVAGADVLVDSVYFNTTAGTNPVASSDMKVFAVVKNAGNRNISRNVTVTFYLDGTSIGTRTITNETLTAGQTDTVNVTYTGSLKQYSSTFNHTLMAYAPTGVTELNATNNNAYNYSLYVGYNATITSINPTRNPGQNLTVNLMVRYPNGTGVIGIPKTNFTISDIYPGQTTHTWGGTGLTNPLGGQNVYNDSFSESGGGAYTFKIGTYNLTSIVEGGTTRAGAHTLRVDIESNVSGKNFNGRSEDSYNLTAPMFDIIYKVRDGDGTNLNGNADMDESSSEDYDIYVVNNGYANLTSVNISVDSFDDNALSAVSEHSCSSKKNVPNDGSAVWVCYISVTTKAVSSDDSGEIDVVAYGTYNTNRYVYDEDDLVISVYDTSVTQTTSSSETSSSTSTSSDTDYPNCVENDDCFGDEFCNSHDVCEELECADDEKIVDHACVKKDDAAQAGEYSLGIVGGPDVLEIEHRGSREVTFNLKNTGQKTLNELKFELEIKDTTMNVSNWYSVISNYSKTLDKGITEPVKVKINTADLQTGTYEIIALAVSDKASSKLTFTLKITPDDDERVVINETMVKLNSDYTEISNQLLVLLHKNANNTNLTDLNVTVAKIADYLKSAKLAIERGDYLTAYENQISAEALMGEVKSKLEDDNFTGLRKNSHVIRNSLIGIAIVALGLYGYRYYRTMQESGGCLLKNNFRIKNKSAFREKIAGDISALKGSIKGKKEKTVPLNPSFNQNPGMGMMLNSSKKEDTNILQRIIEKFRAKKKKGDQRTLYDIGSLYDRKAKKS